jgi:hypothetical protein
MTIVVENIHTDLYQNEKLKEIANVINNGLVVNDVASLLNACNTGGEYKVLSGEYNLSLINTIYLNSNLSLVCEDGTIFTSGPRSMFRPENGSLSIRGARFTQDGDSPDNSIISLDFVARDGLSVRVSQCTSDGVQYVVFASDDKPHNFTIENILVEDGVFTNSVQAAYKVASVKCLKQTVQNCLVEGGNRAGIQAGLVQDAGTDALTSDITNITIKNNRIKNIKPSSVGSAGSNAIRAEGYGVCIKDNYIEDCFSGVGTGPTNVEAIYTKMVSGSILGNTIKNTTANQGAIVVKGGGRSATSTASAGHKIFITNNTIINSSISGEFANSVGIYIQASDVFVDNNHIENMNSRVINTGGVTADLLSNIIISNLMIHKPSAGILIDLVAWLEDVVIRGVNINGIDRTTDAQVIRISPPSGKSINRVSVSDVKVFGDPTGAGRYNLFQVSSAQNTSELSVYRCGGALLKRLIRKDDVGVLDKFTVTDCDLSSPSNVVEVFGGTITNVWTKDNKGWMERTGVINLGTVAANSKTSIYIGSVEDASAGDYAQFALNLPTTIRCEARAAGSGINFLLENTSGASVDLSTTSGVCWTEKRYGSLT